jgi:hypothetical protein
MVNLKPFVVPVLVAVLGGCVVAPARERVVMERAPPETVVVRTAPPVQVVEEVPPPRPGHVWVQGFWRWNGNRHDWVRGHWMPERVGYRYVQPRWDRVGAEWHFTAGFWAHT